MHYTLLYDNITNKFDCFKKNTNTFWVQFNKKKKHTTYYYFTADSIVIDFLNVTNVTEYCIIYMTKQNILVDYQTGNQLLKLK